MITYPNQRVVTVLKEDCNKDFLQIKNDDWQTAGMNIESYGAFKLYLYLASNKNGFSLALSPVAVEDAIGISESTYRRAFKELESLGYLSKAGSSKNQYFFHSAI